MSRLSRLNGQSVTALRADVDNRITTGGQVTRKVLNESWAAMSSQYPDVQVTVGGDQAEQERVKPSMARNFLLSLFAATLMSPNDDKSWLTGQKRGPGVRNPTARTMALTTHCSFACGQHV